MSENFDVVIAGAGHNSLITAAYLAKAGLTCLILEANEQIGGSTATKEMGLAGFKHDTCSTAHNLIQASPTLRNDELGLSNYGLAYINPDPVVHVPFLDGGSITQWRSIDQTVEEFAKFSRKDANSYRRFISDYEEIAPAYGKYRYTPAGQGPSFEELISEGPNPQEWLRRISASAAEIVLNYFEDEHTQAFMLWIAFMTIQPLKQPGTGILPYSLVYGRQKNSWVLPKGGSAALPQALGRYIESHGGKIRTGERITKLLIENDRCVGVETTKGERIHADKSVLSTIHIKHLVEMAPSESYGEQFRQAIDNWESGIPMFVTHYSTATPLTFSTPTGELQAAAAGTPGSAERMLKVEDDIQQGIVSKDEPVLLVLCPTVADSTRAPKGMHTLKVVGFQPYAIDGDAANWDQEKYDVSQANLDYLRTYAPSLTEDKILETEIHSPLDLERINSHNWHGSCHGGATTPSQSGTNRPVPGWSEHRMPISGLYQTGSTTHPGGSVSGAPGRNAAIVMLNDLGFDAKKVLEGK